MGFLLKALVVGLTVAGIGKVKKQNDEEKRRKSTVCNFDGEITEEDFDAMVRCSGKGIKRIIGLSVDGPVVYGTVRSQSGISDWNFRIDFNDYGEVTGRYWISSDNKDSEIPKTIAKRIAQQIDAHKD